MGCCRSRAKVEPRSSSKSTSPPLGKVAAIVKDIERGDPNIWNVEVARPLFKPLPRGEFPRVGVTGIVPKLVPDAQLHSKDASKPSRNRVEEQLQLQLDEISGLAARVHIFKAHSLLQDLLRASDVTVRAEVLRRLASDPLLAKLQSAHKALQSAIDLTMVPALRSDTTWTNCIVKDPKISKDFVLNFSMRMADSSEFEAGGPSSQIIIRGQVSKFPVSLLHFMLLQTEADLARKEWIKDCETIRAWPGGPMQLFRVLVQVLIAPALLPFRLQETLLRTFAVCDRPPFNPGDLGSASQPGVIVMEVNPPAGETEYEGWTLPASAHKRAVSLRGSMKMLYVTPTTDPNAVDVFATARVGVPVSPYLVPLSLFKQLVAELMRESFSRLKEKVIDNWQEYDFDRREAANHAFYEQFRVMHETRVAAG